MFTATKRLEHLMTTKFRNRKKEVFTEKNHCTLKTLISETFLLVLSEKAFSIFSIY